MPVTRIEAQNSKRDTKETIRNISKGSYDLSFLSQGDQSKAEVCEYSLIYAGRTNNGEGPHAFRANNSDQLMYLPGFDDTSIDEGKQFLAYKVFVDSYPYDGVAGWVEVKDAQTGETLWHVKHQIEARREDINKLAEKAANSR